jgi:hypothetical protein
MSSQHCRSLGIFICYFIPFIGEVSLPHAPNSHPRAKHTQFREPSFFSLTPCTSQLSTGFRLRQARDREHFGLIFDTFPGTETKRVSTRRWSTVSHLDRGSESRRETCWPWEHPNLRTLHCREITILMHVPVHWAPTVYFSPRFDQNDKDREVRPPPPPFTTPPRIFLTFRRGKRMLRVAPPRALHGFHISLLSLLECILP